MKSPANRLYRSIAAILFLTASLAVWAQNVPPSATSKNDDALELVKQGQKLNTEGRQDEALALYQKALEENPNLYQAHLAAGVALDLEGKYEEARAHLTKAIELAPTANKVQALRTMAVSYAFENKADEAKKYEQQAFDLQFGEQKFEDAGGTADEAARILLESGDPDNAFQWYQTGRLTGLRKPNITAAEKDLWDFRWESAQAKIAARRGQRDWALQRLLAAKGLLDKGTNPDQMRFYPYINGYVDFYGDVYKSAIAELLKADQKDPAVLALLAQAYEKSGNQALALEFYQQTLAINSHNPANAFARPLARERVAALSKK
jgi:tetratricopeptide (TPR) repeat protein